MKYSFQGGVVQVQVARRDNRAWIMVTDQGMGIPAEDISHLFERFYRASNVDEEQITGMGIGLYIVKEIVTLHGGSVEVESVLAATDVRNLADAAKAAAKLGEIERQLSTLSGNGRVEKARAYVREQLKKRTSARDTIVDRRLENLTSDADGLGWTPPSGGGPQGISVFGGQPPRPRPAVAR